MKAYKIAALYHVPDQLSMVGLREDGIAVIDNAGDWLTREQLSYRLQAMGVKEKEREETLRRFDVAVDAAKGAGTVIYGADGPVAIAH